MREGEIRSIPETNENLEQRIAHIAGILDIKPWSVAKESPQKFYEALAKREVEIDARIEIVDQEGREKLFDAIQTLDKTKRKELEEKFGIAIEPITAFRGDVQAPALHQYESIKIKEENVLTDSASMFLRNYPVDEQKLKWDLEFSAFKNDEGKACTIGSGTHFEHYQKMHEDFGVFQKEFFKLDETTRQALLGYYNWYTSIDGGLLLDACNQAGLIPTEQMQAITKAKSEGKKIFSSRSLLGCLNIQKEDSGIPQDFSSIYFWGHSEDDDSGKNELLPEQKLVEFPISDYFPAQDHVPQEIVGPNNRRLTLYGYFQIMDGEEMIADFVNHIMNVDRGWKHFDSFREKSHFGEYLTKNKYKNEREFASALLEQKKKRYPQIPTYLGYLKHILKKVKVEDFNDIGFEDLEVTPDLFLSKTNFNRILALESVMQQMSFCNDHPLESPIDDLKRLAELEAQARIILYSNENNQAKIASIRSSFRL